MWWWNGTPPMWGLWWIFPLVGLTFVIVVSFAASRFFGGGIGFCGGRRHDDIEDLRRDVRDLKEEVAKLKKQQ